MNIEGVWRGVWGRIDTQFVFVCYVRVAVTCRFLAINVRWRKLFLRDLIV